MWDMIEKKIDPNTINIGNLAFLIAKKKGIQAMKSWDKKF